MKHFNRRFILMLPILLGSSSIVPACSSGEISPQPSPFSVVTVPNPQLKQAVMSIVPTQKKTSPTKAAALAAFAGRQFIRNSAWTEMHIFVFTDVMSAQRFKIYQSKRRQKPLQAADYRALQALWPRTLAYYYRKGKRELIKYPQRAPRTWWR